MQLIPNLQFTETQSRLARVQPPLDVARKQESQRLQFLLSAKSVKAGQLGRLRTRSL